MGKSINYKINLLVIVILLIIFIPAFLALIISKNNLVNQTSELLTQTEKQKLADLSRLTMNMAEIADDLATKMLNIALNSYKEILKKKGEISVTGSDAIKVINQFTKESSVVNLPKMYVGGTAIPIISSFEQTVPIVDEVTKLSGATATLFVRMNQNGDMVRIATTVKTKDGKRAVLTFIPAINPNGEKNPVVSKILTGEEYFGRAFVVDQWYLTAYSPLRSNSGEIVGLIYVGIPQKIIEDKLRQTIYSIKIGKTGYIFVLQGSGESKGTYIISKDGKRDGENIWESKDASGNLFIQEIINQTTKNPGKVYFQRYDWKNLDETKPRTKIAAAVYFKKWDWVIAAGSYEDEIYVVREQVLSSLNEMVLLITIISTIAVIISIIIGTKLSKRISRPVVLSARIAEAIGKGDMQTANNLLNEK